MKSCTNLNKNCPASSISGWLRYFAAAVSICGGGALAQEQVLLNYWNVLPQETPSVSASRVIRVSGEKGGEDEVISIAPEDIRNNAAIKEVCVARLRALHGKAQSLAEEYVSAGTPPEIAYEKAWVNACKLFRVNVIGGVTRVLIWLA